MLTICIILFENNRSQLKTLQALYDRKMDIVEVKVRAAQMIFTDKI